MSEIDHIAAVDEDSTMTVVTTNLATSTITGEFASISFVDKDDTSMAADGSQNSTETISTAAPMTSTQTLAEQYLSEAQEFATSESKPDDNSTLTQMQATTAAEQFIKPQNPCSNDNPEWELGTQPCPNSTTDIESIFEGAVTTPAATTTTTEATTTSTPATTTSNEPETFSTSSIREELPSVYSCENDNSSQTAAGTNTGNNGDSGKEPIYFRFNYEMFTPPDRTEDEINDTLSEFERKLGFGVAQAVGLANCPVQSLRAGANRHTLTHRNYVRRSLQQRDPGSWNGDGYDFVEVSIEPKDFIDRTLLDCTSEVTLDNPNECTPIHGFMSVWISVEEVRNLRQLATAVNSEEETPEEFLLRTVQTYMEQNQTHYLSNDLLHVAYVGERDLNINNIDPEVLARPVGTNAETEAGNRSSSKYIGIGVAGIFVMVLLLGLVCAYRKKDRQVDDVEMDMERDNENDNAEMLEVLSTSSSDSMHKEDEDGSFPSVRNMDSMRASDGGSINNSPPKLLLNESTESSVPPSLDPHVPSDNLFGLRGKVCSDEYPASPKKEHESDDDEMEPLSPTNNENIKDFLSLPLQPAEDDSQSSPIPTADLDDDSEISLPKISEEEENYHSSDKSLSEEEHKWAGRVLRIQPVQSYSTPEESNMSPSEATEKISNTAPFLVENASSDIEDRLDSDDEDENDPEGLKQDSLPSIV